MHLLATSIHEQRMNDVNKAIQQAPFLNWFSHYEFLNTGDLKSLYELLLEYIQIEKEILLRVMKLMEENIQPYEVRKQIEREYNCTLKAVPIHSDQVVNWSKIIAKQLFLELQLEKEIIKILNWVINENVNFNEKAQLTILTDNSVKSQVIFMLEDLLKQKITQEMITADKNSRQLAHDLLKSADEKE